MSLRATATLGSGIGVLALVLSGCTSPAAPVGPTSPPQIQPRLILVQVLDRSEYAVGNALMSGSLPESQSQSESGEAVDVDQAPAASSIAYLPASVLVPVVGVTPPRNVTLGATPIIPDTLAAKTSTEAAFDLALDGTWTLDVLAFAGLIDAVGGVFVDLPQAVRLTNPQAETAIILPAGRQRLSGIAAAEYVTTDVGSDFPVDQLQRFRDVWIAVLARLPDSPERLRQILTSLGFLARTTASVETLLEVLESGRTAVLDRSIDEQFVTVDVIRGGARPAAVITPAGSRTVATMFAEFAVPGPDPKEAK